MTQPSLDRAIGPTGATLLVVGSVIGSGIFSTTGVMAVNLPSATLLVLAWTAGCVFALMGALTYAELGAMFPRSGGVYVFLREAFGPLPGFLYGWATLAVVLAGGLAAVATVFADYLSYFFPALGASTVIATVPVFGGLTIAANQVVAVLSIVVLGGVNYLGVRMGSGTNAVLLPLFALFAGRATPEWTPVVPAGVASPLAAFGVALVAVMWAVEGFYFLTFSAGEVKDPHRVVPRAQALGLLTIMAVYVTVNLAYMYALPMDALQASGTRVAEAAATAMVGQGGATIIAVAALASTLGANAAVMLAGSRLFYAMANDRVFFPAASAVHPRYHSPHVAIIGLTIWASILALSGTFEQLFTYVVFTSVLFGMIAGVAFFALRASRPDADRPYRVWGYPVVPALFVMGGLFLVVNTLKERPFESLAGLALLVPGLAAYFYWRSKA
jgi:APA family basic amino acid/polyamine antiporter